MKLRGFYSPQFFVPILTATIDDPSPVNYPDPGGEERGRSLATGLTEAQRNEILDFIDKAWDEEHGGWSKSKFVDGNMLIWVLQRARQGDAVNTARIKKVLDLDGQHHDRQDRRARPGQSEAGLVGPGPRIPDVCAGGRPCRLFARLDDVRRSRLPADRRSHLWISPRQDGRTRRRLLRLLWHERGRTRRRPPIYTRETAQAVAGLLAYSDATGVAEARDLAARAVRWVLDNRALPGGGFRHAEQDKGGPYLADNVEMAKALLALHRSTGEREWLTRAQATADFIAKTFIDPATGGFVASASPDAKQITKPIKQREDNVTAVRMFALLWAYTGEAKYREIAEAGMGYLTSPPVLDAFSFLPDVLLAEDELRNEPVHVTIVGAKDDPRSAALYRAALAYPLVNKRAEWWDKREGKLANPDVDYPDFPEGPAAFACTSTFCSYPVTQASEIAAQLDNLKRARKL